VTFLAILLLCLTFKLKPYVSSMLAYSMRVEERILQQTFSVMSVEVEDPPPRPEDRRSRRLELIL